MFLYFVGAYVLEGDMWEEMGRGFTWIYVSTGHKKVQNLSFEKNLNFQNGFAYFVGQAWAQISTYGPIGPYVLLWVLMGPFVRFFSSA